MNVIYFEVRTRDSELVAACKYEHDAEIFATLVHPGATVVQVGSNEKEIKDV